MKKYSIIYADPPWSYQNGGVPQGGVDAQYRTMTLGDIKKLPINSLADDTCVLMMWATFPQMQEAQVSSAKLFMGNFLISPSVIVLY